ncbi:AraC-type DNA-binding protein [Jatrophihabitans endophyticus]|uniref:HTH-type transcriptional regulator RipA n=1 Tax=Jatrophihabitans endophyticus TaxID=1206085 RepID=A0A1M5E0B5_9ACTN|nr:AraC family transcriptional regulator [Jatrophihabitans endophyticus]SHF72554.1 AraC-type DNA-binding protein [Jatrophihabitans endophyticus]
MRMEANRYRATANPESTHRSPILRIDSGTADGHQRLPTHSHPEPMLMWTATATVMGIAGSREWLIPPGYGLWIPGGVEHTGTVLHAGEMSIVTFAAEGCPITWSEPTGIEVGTLLRELVAHLDVVGPAHPTRPHAEALMFALLTPLATQDVHAAVPTDPRARAVAERLLADPADQRELAAWADEVHASVRTLSRLFRAETGLSFASWRTQVRMRAAARLLAGGASVSSTARAVGYRRPSAFVDAFRRSTGQTPGTYLPRSAGRGRLSTPPDLRSVRQPSPSDDASSRLRST